MARPSPWWRLLALIAAGSLVGLLAYGLLRPGASNRIAESLAEGKAAPAPDFDVPLVEKRANLPPSQHLVPLFRRGGSEELRTVWQATQDGSLALEELRGVPIVLNFWASWCDPCREEAPILELGWKRDQERGVLYLGLNMQDITEDALLFQSEYNLTYPSISEPGNEVGRSFGATGIPETHFIDARGRVVGRVIGTIDAEMLRRGVRGALRGEVVGTMTPGQTPGRAKF